MKKQLKEKIEKIFGSCKGIDKIFIRNTFAKDPNFVYLTGFSGGVFEDNLLIVERRGLTLYTNPLDYGTAKEQKFEGVKIVNTTNSEKLKNMLYTGLKGKTVGINGTFLPYTNYKRLKARFKPRKIVDVSESFSKARLVKSVEEIKSIKKAVKITKKAIEEVRKEFEEGITERELARRFDDISELLGAEEPSTVTLICFGKNAAIPHHVPDNTKLKKGDFVLIDAGSKVNNYCSDITRTFIFGNKSEVVEYRKKIEMYQIVKEAQKKAISMIKPGVKGKDIDEKVREYINTALNGKYRDTFTHSLGHSLGIEEHDGESLAPASELVLKENMVSTVEPGIYLPGFGGVRIEDDVVVTKNGYEIL